MPQKRHYDVAYRFPVRTKKDELVWIDRSKADQIEELLSDDQIKEHLKAGNLVDNGAVIPEPPKKAS